MRTRRPCAAGVRRYAVQLAASFLALTLLGSAASAQAATLTLSTSTVTIPAPTAAEYNAGYSATQTLAYTMQYGVILTLARTATVRIRTTSSNLAPSKSIGHLEWRRSGTQTWTPITGSFVTVQQQTVVGLSASFSGTIEFRMRLDWASDDPRTYQANVEVQLTS